MRGHEGNIDYSESLDIAIVGMAGRFPGANNLDEFWQNLKYGVESINFYSEDEVIESGIPPDMARAPNFVPAAGGIEHEFDFDADFFDFNPREAEITDPQQRIALECAWEALEAAGCNPETYPGVIGVFAGVSINTYLLFNLINNHQIMNSVGQFGVMTASDKDFLATRIAYKLNLRGPAISVQTACSTGLVAVNLAAQSLLNYQSDMVLAGGVSITPKGRLYSEGFIFSQDGHCRAFDEAAQGTVGGNGVGFVVLKRLSDAVKDNDHIHAIIKGSAINNDGSLKVGYTAPSVTGQRDVILEAQAMAGVEPETITYVEAHGTGTLLGDPIEMAALTQAFRTQTDKTQYCAVGSVKSNIGHLDTAAGTSGLIKAILAVENKQIPPTLHFKKANPKLNIEQSPFYINTELSDWNPPGIPRRAAISSFGFGGTNAHTIIEEAPSLAPTQISHNEQLLVVSARDENALKENIVNLGQFLNKNPAINLADTAYTLQVGRKHFKHRAYLVAKEVSDAAKALESYDLKRIVKGKPRDVEPTVAFMFSGQGSQYIGMTRDLYDNEPVFRSALDRVANAMAGELETDLRDIIYPKDDQESAKARLAQTQYTQPALFAVEYALAQLWLSLGVNATTMIGHSVGEYVAATLAGVFTLEDAARLICLRGKIIQAQAGGSMLSIPLAESQVTPLLNSSVSLAVVNAPNFSVVAGETAAINALKQQLAEQGTESTLLHVSHAFHSHMLEDAAKQFADVLASVNLQSPQKRYISNVTGTWITAEQATNPQYWAEHLRKTVRFSEGLITLLAEKPSVLLEVGPGQALTTLARQHRQYLNDAVLISSTRHPLVETSDQACFTAAVGQLFLAGISPDWKELHHQQPRRKTPLPTYRFQRQRYWLPPVFLSHQAGSLAVESVKVEAPRSVHKHDSDNYEAPRDQIEYDITSIWESMLGISQIGINDDFFKLGGHSLLAIQLIAEVRNVTRTEVTVQELFKNPTVAGLADEVRALRQSNPDFQATTIPLIERGDILPLSHHQQSVWQFEQQFPGTSCFIGFMALKITGKLQQDALQFAVNELVRRHEILRTTYQEKEGQVTAIVNPFEEMVITHYDLSSLPPATRDQRLLEISTELASRPFDIKTDLCVRTCLIKMTEQEHTLIISSHYIASDSWSSGIVVQELGAHYKAFLNPDLPRMPERPYQFVDYAARNLAVVNQDYITARLPYWREQLADYPAQFPVPTDYERKPTKSMKGSTYHFSFGQALTDEIKDFTHQHGATLFLTILAAINALYHSYSKSEDIIIGSMVGDHETGTEAMIGSVINTLALRTHLSGDDTFIQLVEKVRQAANSAYEKQVPFAALLADLQIDFAVNPLFRTAFILRTVPYLETNAGDVNMKFDFLPTNRGSSDTDLTLYLQDEHGVLGGYYEYSEELFKASTIEGVVNDLIFILRNVLAEPEVAISQLLPIKHNI